MFREHKMHEVEKMIKEKKLHDLSLDTFATISGIRGVQFGREIFSTVIPFKDLATFLSVFPDVQRQMIPHKVSKIKKYVLSGLDPNNMRFFSAITVTSRGHVFYSDVDQKVAIDTHKSKLSINDGQHRFFGIAAAIEFLEKQINSPKVDSDKKEVYRTQKKELEEMVIPIVIFNQISEKEEKQLFSDLNLLAQRPSRSATIKLAQTDIVARLARELAETNKYLTHYGVEYDKTSIHANNPNSVLLTTVFAGIKELFKKDIQGSAIKDSTYRLYLDRADKVFNKIFFALPSDIDTKGKYILEKSYALRGIMKFYYEAVNDMGVDEKTIEETIRKVDWTNNPEYWKPYGGQLSKRGAIQFAGYGDRGMYQVYQALHDELQWKDKQLTLDEVSAAK